MLLVQTPLPHYNPILTPQERNLQILLIHDIQPGITKFIAIRKHVGRGIIPYSTQSLDISRTARNNIRRGLGITEPIRVGSIVEHGSKKLGIVHVAKDTDIDAVALEQGFKRRLAGRANVARVAGAVPGSVAGYDEPGRDAAVYRGQVSVEELQLLGGCVAKWTGVEACAAVYAVWCRWEVGFGVDDDDMCHAVLERVPERGVGEGLGLCG